MMKHVLAAAITSAALMLASGALADGGPAPEPPPPPVYEPPPPPEYKWYTTIFAGATFPDSLTTDFEFFDPFEGDEFFIGLDTSLNTGYLLGWTLGYDNMFDGDIFQLRPEVEFSFRQNDVDFETTIFELFDEDVDAAIFDGFSDPTDVLSLMFNLWFDFDFQGFNPYLGGGIGVGWADIPDPFFFFPHFSDTSFVWQVGAGFNYDLNDRVFIGVGYRFFSGDFDRDFEFGIDPFFDPDIFIAPFTISNDYSVHEVLFNMGVRF